MSLAAGTPAPQTVWASLSEAQRNAAYDNNGAVANSAALVEARNAASAAYRKAHPGGLDIPYAPGARTAFDLYPARDPAAPCLVFIHGGYWLRNSRELFAAYGEGLALAGWSIAMPGYTLAPQASSCGHRRGKSARRSTGSPTRGGRMASGDRWCLPAGRPARNWRRCISSIGTLWRASPFPASTILGRSATPA